jgi:enoyl-CoA hydratase/carnithine racemase
MPIVTLEILPDFVALIQFRRPEAKNAISLAFLHEFWEAIKNVLASPKVRVLLITGQGDAFCAGADLKERANWGEREIVSFLEDFGKCLFTLEKLPIPTIASINGFAFGGGLELALACDLIFAANTAIVGLTETKLGIIPGAGGTQRLSRLVGGQTAKEWIFRAQKIEAEEALKKGLFAGVFPSATLYAETLAIARDITASAPLAIKAAKKAIQGSLTLDLESGLEWERICYYDTIRSKDRTEALLAFKEKRKPKFIGE